MIEDKFIPLWKECALAGLECCICTKRIKVGEIMFIAPGYRDLMITGRHKIYMHRKCVVAAMEFAPTDTYEQIRQRVLAGGEFLQ